MIRKGTTFCLIAVLCVRYMWGTYLLRYIWGTYLLPDRFQSVSPHIDWIYDQMSKCNLIECINEFILYVLRNHTYYFPHAENKLHILSPSLSCPKFLNSSFRAEKRTVDNSIVLNLLSEFWNFNLNWLIYTIRKKTSSFSDDFIWFRGILESDLIFPTIREAFSHNIL